jgi:4a-hydroxytetrahydrobiopterin dehydratase
MQNGALMTDPCSTFRTEHFSPMATPVCESSTSQVQALRLADQHCVPVQGVPGMSEQETRAMLGQSAELEGWRWQHHALEKAFDFADFHETMAFVNAAAWICHREDHHPTLTVTFNRCVARFDTHSVGGISMNDFICAAKVNALLRRVCP